MKPRLVKLDNFETWAGIHDGSMADQTVLQRMVSAMKASGGFPLDAFHLTQYDKGFVLSFPRPLLRHMRAFARDVQKNHEHGHMVNIRMVRTSPREGTLVFSKKSTS